MKWFAEFYDKTMKPIEMKIWFEMFQNLTVQKLHDALLNHIRHDDQPWFPAPGKITLQIPGWTFK